MSYAVTEAGMSDMMHELRALDELAGEIDQLAADARKCETLCPQAKAMLDIAWYFAEKALRETQGHCSAHSPNGWCACCAHFNELRNRAEAVGRRMGF